MKPPAPIFNLYELEGRADPLDRGEVLEREGTPLRRVDLLGGGGGT